MKVKKNLFGVQRQKKIKELLRIEKRVSVAELAERFETSEVTIRSDLNAISDDKTIIRTHGGAVYIEEFPRGGFYEDPREVGRAQADSRPYESLERQVHAGDVVYLDGPLPTERLFNTFSERTGLTIITRNVPLAQRIAKETPNTAILLGGVIDPDQMITKIGPLWTSGQSPNISWAVLSADSFSLDAGASDQDPEEAAMKREIVKLSRSIVAIVPGRRLDTVSLSTFCGASDITMLITDEVPPCCVDTLDAVGIEVIEEGAESSLVSPFHVSRMGYSRFNNYRRNAKLRTVYEGEPGKNRKIAFALLDHDEPFSRAVEAGIRVQSELAGFDAQNILMLDNHYDFEQALSKADQVLEGDFDVFVEYQYNFTANSIIRAKFDTSNTHLVAVDIPMHGVPFVGIDHWSVGAETGRAARAIAKKKWGPAENADLIVLFESPEGGEVSLLRGEGFLDAIQGDSDRTGQPRIVRIDVGNQSESRIDAATTKLLEETKGAKRIAFSSVTERCARRVIKSLLAKDQWDPEKFVVVTQGCDPESRGYIRSGYFDASVAFFPERYGELILPVVCALIDGEPVPPYVFMQSRLIDRSNIDQFYGKDTN